MFKYNFILVVLLSISCSINAQNTKLTIQNYLTENQAELGLSTDDLTKWEISSEQYNKNNKSIQVYIQQYHNEIPILNAIGNVTLTQDSRLFINADAMVNSIASKVVNKDFPDANVSLNDRNGINEETIDSKPIYFLHLDKLEPCLLVSYETLDQQHYYFKVYDTNGDILKEWDQVIHCSFGHSGFSQAHNHIINREYVSNRNRRGSDAQYNVYPVPVESPNHGPRAIISGEEDPTASPFGWHDVNGQVGPEYTTTRGNNVNAYEDLSNSNSQGYAPDGGANLIFNYPIDAAAEPDVNIDAAITNLFYLSNFMHDWSYQYGFDEANGNFQQNNYGNGGTSNDVVLAEAQDGGGTNNANFSTFWDGSKPRMQMYVWEGAGGAQEILTVNSPVSLGGAYFAATAEFGNEIDETPTTGDLVVFEDATDPTSDACTGAVNGAQLSGKIALIDRGDCTFVIKVKAAQNAGAIAAVIVNNVEGPPGFMGGTDGTITIPSVMVTKADGDLFKAALESETVNITLLNDTEELPALDGDYDNGIIAHEYTHGISNRLVGGRFNTFCLTNQEQMGEGWSDYYALMATINLEVTNPIRRPVGTYVRSESPDQGFGIRPVPYDTSFAVNSYTYGNLNSPEVSIPHGVGFIWCTMLWDMTWALIDKYGYDEDIYTGTGGNNIALQLVTDAMKLVNCNPGFVQSRDAILQADLVNNNGANTCLIWEVFAKRGLGFSASQGNPNNVNDGVEAFDMPTSCADISDQVAFSADKTIVCDGVVQFTDETSVTSTQWTWDFGDGETSNEQNPMHTYLSNGTYTVTLTVGGDNGFGTAEIESYIDVTLPEIPTNVFVGEPCLGDYVLVTAEVEYGEIVWTRDGEFYATLDSIYPALLAETETFTAYNQIIVDGDTCTSESVEVNITTTMVDFNYVANGLEVQFTDATNNAQGWSWDFGDNTSSTEQNPTHTYAEGGTYEVTLTVNESNCVSTQIINLEVTGVLEQLDDKYITISPNPASQFALVTLSEQFSEDFVIKAFNAEGQEMAALAKKVRNNSYEIDLSKWANGMYTIQLISEEWTAQKTLIVTKN